MQPSGQSSPVLSNCSWISSMEDTQLSSSTDTSAIHPSSRSSNVVETLPRGVRLPLWKEKLGWEETFPLDAEPMAEASVAAPMDLLRLVELRRLVSLNRITVPCRLMDGRGAGVPGVLVSLLIWLVNLLGSERSMVLYVTYVVLNLSLSLPVCHYYIPCS